MGYQNSRYIPIKQPFSKGYVDNTPQHLLEDAESPFLRNARLDGQSTIIRPGHALFKDIGGTGAPKGIGVYNRDGVMNDRIVIRQNIDATHKITTLDSTGAQVDISTGILVASDNFMNFTNGQDVIYTMNGSDLFGKLSGTTYTNPGVVPTNFAPAFSVIFNGSHWASGWPTNPSKVYKSVGSNYEDFSSAGNDVFTFQGTVTGLTATNQSLFYFTADNVFVTAQNDITSSGSPAVVSYFNRPLQTQEGSINNQSIVTAGDNVYYVSPSNKIIAITRGQAIYGFDTNYISSRKYRGIEKIMNTLDPDQSDCFGYFIPNKNVCKWFFKTAGSTFNNICIIYDIVKDAFLVDSNKYFSAATWYLDTGYTTSGFESKVFKDEFGQDDEDMPISFEYRSKRYDLGDPTMRKEFLEARTYIQINQLASVTQETYVDDELIDSTTIDSSNIPAVVGGIGALPIGDFAIGDEIDNSDEMQDVVIVRSKGNLRRRGKYIQFRWTCNTLAAKLSLQGMDIRAEVLPPDAINRTTGT